MPKKQSPHPSSRTKKMTKPCKTNTATAMTSMAPSGFVTNFLAIMLHFPSKCGQLLSHEDEAYVCDFFVRVARFASKTTATALFSFTPLHPITAFMIANYPEETLRCSCNPFRPSILHRSLRFVGACFQVVVECRRDEDDSADDFLPPSTAQNFFASLVDYIEVLRMYSIFFKNRPPCQCQVKVTCSYPYYNAQSPPLP